jgi:hypothetical protein
MTRIRFISDVDSPSHLAGKAGEVKDFDQDYWAELLVKGGYAVVEKESNADKGPDSKEARPQARNR